MLTDAKDQLEFLYLYKGNHNDNSVIVYTIVIALLNNGCESSSSFKPEQNCLINCHAAVSCLSCPLKYLCCEIVICRLTGCLGTLTCSSTEALGSVSL